MSAEVVDLLMKYEITIGQFYAACAEKFPVQAPFWNRLADEEKKHALEIKTLCRKVDSKTIFLEEARFKIRPLEISIEYVEKTTERVKGGLLNLIEALSIAHSIETSILESNYFELFAGDSVSLNHHLKKIKEESNDHQKRVKEMLDQTRAGEP